MKKMGMALILVLTLAVVACGAAAENGTKFVVQGSASVTADPDMVNVTVNMGASAPTAAQAQEKIGEAVVEATRKLLEMGVAEEDIVTENYGFYATYNYEGDQPRISGYQANHTLRIVCRDVKMLDGVLTIVGDSGVGEVYNIAYDVSKRTEMYNQALCDALLVAGGKAQRMAAAVGCAQLRLVSVVEDTGYGGYGVESITKDMAMGGTRETGIRSGTINVSAKVSVTYEVD